MIIEILNLRQKKIQLRFLDLRDVQKTSKCIFFKQNCIITWRSHIKSLRQSYNYFGIKNAYLCFNNKGCCF